MANMHDHPEDTRLEADLVDLGRRIDYPPTPDIASAVHARLTSQPAPIQAAPGRITHLRRWPMPAAAGLLVILVTTLALIPDTRDAIADRLGLRGAEIVVTPTVNVPAGQNLLLGEQMPQAVAVAQLDFQPYLPPPGLSAPDAVYLLEPPLGGQISYVYLSRSGLPEAPETGVGLLISQFRGDTNESFIAKQLGAETTLEVVDVNGATGFWISGAPHVFAYEDANGEFQQETIRLAANVLIWENDGLTLRIESDLTKDEVLALAEAMTR